MDEECTCKTVVLTQKRKGNLRGVGIVEVLWKGVARLLNHRFTEEISYHDALHRFQEGRGTGIATFKAKLLQQLTAMSEAVLFEVFMYLQKAYDALDQERAL